MVDRPKSRSLLSTGELADALGVGPASVIRWIDSGILRGHRLPSTGHGGTYRRIALREALRFAAAHGLVTESLVRLAADAGLTVPWLPAALVITLDRLRPEDFVGVDVTISGNQIQTGFILAQRAFDLILVDCAIGRSEARSLGSFLRHVRQHVATGAIVSEDDQPADWNDSYTLAWKKPADFPRCLNELWQKAQKTKVT